MRQLKIVEHLSLDGVIQHSDDGDGFPYSDWSAPYRTPVGRVITRLTSDVDALNELFTSGFVA